MTRKRARVTLWLALPTMLLVLAWQARSALIPFAVGAVIAYALEPVVEGISRPFERLADRPSRRRLVRSVAVAVIYLVFFGTITAIAIALVPVTAEQIRHFVEQLPSLVQAAQERGDYWLRAYHERVPVVMQERIDALSADAANAAADAARGLAQRTVGFVTGTVGLIFGFAIVPFWMFYVIRDRPSTVPALLAAVPAEAREDVANLLNIADRTLGRYIRGQLFLGVLVGMADGIVLTLLGVELSVALGVFAGVTELIPIVGPWIGAVPGLLIVAATNPGLLVPVALTYLAVQQLENNFLVPRIQSQAVDLHPAVIILLLAVAGAVAGFVGLVVVVPLAAILRHAFWYADHRLRGATPAEAHATIRIGSDNNDSRTRAVTEG